MMNTLMLRDIAHISPDYKPLFPAAPCVFTEGVDPLPLTKDFTSPEAFRAFWKGEREGNSWLFVAEKSSRRWYDPKLKFPMSTLPVATIPTNGRGGRPILYDWTIKHVCRFKGTATAQQEQRKRRESVRQDCPVFIRIHKLCSENNVRIEYYWKHSHSTDKVFNAEYPSGRNEHHWLGTQVKEGNEWRDLRKMLTPSSRQLTQVD